MVVVHNLLAMNTQRQFNITGIDRKKSTEKLSSGYKINRAADDAAGLTISEKMRSMIRGLNQGSKNTQDGISWCQVADGAMAEVHDMLHRMKELSVKAANGTNTDADRRAINEEVQALIDEINRIDDSTEFNTMHVFLRGNTVLEVENEPGDLEYYNATKDGDNITYGGFIFHGVRIPFNDIKNENGQPIVKMENGVQVFNGGTYTVSSTDHNGDTVTTKLIAEKGSKVPDIKREIDINAEGAGIRFDGSLISWDNVFYEDGRSFTEAGPQYGTWTVKYGRSTVRLTIENNNSLRSKEEFIKAINNYKEIQDNGGVSYTWTTELTEEPTERSVYLDDATFFDTSDQRTVDNVMAYETNCDPVNTSKNLDKNSSGLGYTLRAIKVNSNPTELATSGTDKNVNLELFLVGSDGKKVSGSSKFITIPAIDSEYPAIGGTGVTLDNLSGGHSIGSFSAGTDITDDDWCNGNIKDGVTDYVYHYKDNSGKTGIEFDFRLSDVSSADTVEDGLDLVKFVQYYGSQYTDQISLSSDANSKVSILTDGIHVFDGKTTYIASYNIETALGRDFSDPNDVLAVIDGKNVGDEGNIIYDKTTNPKKHTISFKVSGNTADKTSTNYAATKADNNIVILDFSAETNAEENEMAASIISNTNKLIREKINSVLDGKGSDSVPFTPGMSFESRTVTLTDMNVRSNEASYDSDFEGYRSYSFEYKYGDIFKQFNSGNADTTDIGEQINIEMENDDGMYSAGYDSSKLDERWLKLTGDLSIGASTRTTDQYINAKILVDTIDSIVGEISDAVSKNAYVYDEFANAYVTENEYRDTVKAMVSQINGKGTDISTDYIVDENGKIRKESELSSKYETDFKAVISEIVNNIASSGYIEKDEYNNPVLVDDEVIPLSGEYLRDRIINNISALENGENKESIQKIKDAVKEYFESNPSVSASAEGEFDVSGIINQGDISYKMAADKLTYMKEHPSTAVASDDNFNILIDASVDPKLKDMLTQYYDSSKLPKGSFKLTELLKNSIFNPDKVADEAVKNAVHLVDPQKEQPAGKEISPDKFKELVADSLTGFDSGTSKQISDYLKKYIDDNWESIKTGFTAGSGEKGKVNGKIYLSGDLKNKLTAATVSNYTDNKIMTIKAYYGDVAPDNLADKEVKKSEFINKSNTFVQEVASGDKSALTVKVADAATEYAEHAMQDIADSMKFTMEATMYSHTTMTTIARPSAVNRAVYDSEVEIEYDHSLKIQHSGIQDDFTEIQQFCLNAAAMKISSLRVNTEGSARRAMSKIDDALAYVSEKRSYIGAVQNRLEHTFRNNENKAENTTAAESRIRDTDMATEMVKNTKLNILEQAIISMMTQANQSTQGVMSVLQ